jgi:hypothetical protein
MKINKIIEHINNNNNNHSQDRLTFQNSSKNLIVNDYIDNNSICLFFSKVTTYQKRGEWDLNPYPSNVGSTIKY